MIKLYGSARSRATLVQWYLEEIGVPFEFVTLDMQAGEHRQPDYLKLNPFGKVPAIVDGDFVLWESGAILLYLAEKYAGLSELHQRAIATQWVLYANATLGPNVFNETTREKEFPRHCTALNEILSQRPFLLGDEFTVVDVAVGAILNYIPMMLKLDFAAYPAIAAYVQKLSARPAFQSAVLGKRS